MPKQQKSSSYTALKKGDKMKTLQELHKHLLDRESELSDKLDNITGDNTKWLVAGKLIEVLRLLDLIATNIELDIDEKEL